MSNKNGRKPIDVGKALSPLQRQAFNKALENFRTAIMEEFGEKMAEGLGAYHEKFVQPYVEAEIQKLRTELAGGGDVGQG